MRVERSSWRSEQTRAEMPVVRYGDRGRPLLYLPTSGGNEDEFERYGLPEDCASWIEAGRVQVFSVDGFGPRGLFDDALPPEERLDAYGRFERYAIDELLPWIASVTGDPRLELLGASYGAFVAANLFLRAPGAVQVVCGMGGVYSMEHRLLGLPEDATRSRMPLHQVRRIGRESLATLRATGGFQLFGAENDPWLPSTYQFARALEEQAILHRLDIWRAPADHHERWWKEQTRVFLERRHGSPEAACRDTRT